MRVLAGPRFVAEMEKRRDPTPDCFVRPGEYQHHLYIDGVKFLVAQALDKCLKLAEERRDEEALLHLNLHREQCKQLMEAAKADPDKNALLGPRVPAKDAATEVRKSPAPKEPETFEDLGLSSAFLTEMIIRTLYNRGRMSGSEIAESLCVPFGILNDLLPGIRKQGLIDLVAHRNGAIGDAGAEYEIKPPKGTDAVTDALKKTEYAGPLPVAVQPVSQARRLSNHQRRGGHAEEYRARL